MGMFDYVRCELPVNLPGWYQTKDADNEMKIFVISADGRLLKHDYDLEMTPEDELPHKGAPEGSILRLFGCMRKKAGSDRIVDQHFDGDLRFYSADETYRATFRAGACREVCAVRNGEWVQIWSIPCAR